MTEPRGRQPPGPPVGPPVGRRAEPPARPSLASRPWHVAVGSLAAGLALAQAEAPIALAVAACALACLAWFRAPGLAVVAAGLLLAGSAAGDARLRTLDHFSALIGEGRPISARADLLTHPRPSAFGASAEARVETGPLAGARVLLRFADRGARPALPHSTAIGSELALAGWLRNPAPDPDAGFDFAAHLRRRGIAGELTVDRVRVTGRRRGGIVGALDRLRGRAKRAVFAGLDESDAALALGMVLGEDEQIDTATRDDWRDAGLSHLLAVSGQNVMLLMALAVPLLVAAGLGPRGRGIALVCLVALYVPLAGAGPSLQRAGVMGAAGIAAMTLSRPSSRWYALLLAAAVTLALNPRACGDPGWQLSFIAVAGILVAARPLAARLRRIAQELAGPRAGRDRRPGRGWVRKPPSGGCRRWPAPLSTVSARASRSLRLPRSPRRRCWRTTSARFRSPGSWRTCLRCPLWPPPCGSGWSRPRSVWPHRCCQAPTGSPRHSARSRTCRSGTSTGSPSAAQPCPARGSSCRLAQHPRWWRRTQR